MTQPPGSEPPADDERAARPAPPYPGWSAEQPPPSWAAPGGEGSEESAGWGAPTRPPAGGPPPAWGSRPDDRDRQQPAWGGAAPWVPQGPPPAPKPGVVPLRPLGVGELLDGAVTTLRRNPGAMLGLSAVVATVSQVLQMAALWVLFRDLAALDELATATAQAQSFELVAGALTSGLSALAVGVMISWLAIVLLTGVLTVVVSRAVLGEHATIGEAWRQARPQLPRLLALTLVIGLVVLAPFAVGALPAALAALGGGGAAVVGGLAFLGVLLAVPVSVLLYVRLSLSTPALVLETTTDSTGAQRRTGVVAAMRRSAHLVAGSWWRVFGILLLAMVLVWVVQQVIAVPITLLSFLVEGLTTDAGLPTALGLVLQGFGGIVGVTITAPFSAGVVVLLYVDRRIRREALDLELARAAGVEATPPGPA